MNSPMVWNVHVQLVVPGWCFTVLSADISANRALELLRYTLAKSACLLCQRYCFNAFFIVWDSVCGAKPFTQIKPLKKTFSTYCIFASYFILERDGLPVFGAPDFGGVLYARCLGSVFYFWRHGLLA